MTYAQEKAIDVAAANLRQAKLDLEAAELTAHVAICNREASRAVEHFAQQNFEHACSTLLLPEKKPDSPA